MSNESNNSVLVVDKDENTASMLQEPFEMAHLKLLKASFAEEGLAVAQKELPRAILSEVDLPDMGGFNLHRKVRENKHLSKIPFIYYTERTDEIDVVVGFELGAADYISKTVKGREVALRIQAILKRVDPFVLSTGIRSIGNVQLNLHRNTAFLNGEHLPLTTMELHILAALAAAEGRVLSRKEIVAAVWKGIDNVARRTVDVHIKSMRAKLMNVGFAIHTVRGVGYCLRVTKDGTDDARDFKLNFIHNSSHQEEKQLPSMMHQTVLSRTESGR